MPPIEVVNLLSDDDDDDAIYESPSKLLRLFDVRSNASKAESVGRPKTANSIINGNGNGNDRQSSSASADSASDSIDSHHAPGGARREQQSHSQSQSPRHSIRTFVSPSGFKTFTLSSTPAPAALSSTDPSGQNFTPPVLSREAWSALGSPGRKLKQEYARIQQSLESVSRQSEPQRMERVEKAEKYQQRRLSGEKVQVQSHGATTPITQASRNGHMGSASETALDDGQPSSPANTYTASPEMPQFTVLELPTALPESGDVSSTSHSHAGLPNDQGTKRPWDSLRTGLTPVKRARLNAAIDEGVHVPSSKVQVVDVTDTMTERITMSSEPEPDDHSSLALSRTIPPAEEPFSISSSPVVAPVLASTGQSGKLWTKKEDMVLRKLKEVDKLSWKEISAHFPRRTTASIQVRYSSNIKGKMVLPATSPPGSVATALRPQVVSDGVRSARIRHMPLTSNARGAGTLTADPSSGFRSSNKMFTAQDNALLKKLKDGMNMKWANIHAYFPERSLPSLQVHYSTEVKDLRIDTSSVVIPSPDLLPATVTKSASGASNFGSQYSAEELVLLKKLKEVDRLDFKAMVPFFRGRTAGSLQACWYTKIKEGAAARQASKLGRSDAEDLESARTEHAEDAVDDTSNVTTIDLTARQDMVFPQSFNRIIRQRELGSIAGSRAWASSRCKIPDELKNHVYKEYTLQHYYHGTSGDVVGLSWSPDGKRFAAGSIAITDHRSMQYNMSRNLLVGDSGRAELQELVEHHVARPMLDEVDNPNSSDAMRQTQDPRLFLTVAATAFSPVQGESLFTAGTDRMLRKYTVATDVRRTVVDGAAEHSASVDLLAVHQDGIVATGCRSAADSINVFECGQSSLENVWTGSPKRQDLQTSAPIFPSTLKWGAAHAHRNYLLAGFSGDEDKLLAGETVLWDVQQQRQLELRGVTRNVFDVCWNPRPTPTSVVFAVASSSTGMKLGRGMRTAVSCFAPSEPLSAVIRWECPALDINDVLICPHNEQLVAAGATDGRVYVWDQRWAAQGQAPLQVLSHGGSLNVLPHGCDPELTDSGVRFLSWGATSSRLYSGSSDGIIRVWNPYRAGENAHVENIDVPRQHRSAIMSGMFSPDYRELLVGTENGRINVFRMGGNAVHKAEQFKLHTAPEPHDDRPPFEAAAALVHSGKITMRPCGAMPIIQAVQGEAYDGPFQAPTPADLAEAERRLQEALIDQADLAAKRAQEGHDSPHDTALEKAQIRVRDAQTAIEDLQDRMVFAEQSRPKAQSFQHGLRQAREERQKLLDLASERFGTESVPCRLDCTYLPRLGELDDSTRSELRIPGALRAFSRGALTASRLEEEDETPEMCSKCFPLQARKGAKRHLCLACKLGNMHLTTECSKCSAPARVETDETKQALCEACAFACFRCAGPTTLSHDTRLVSCESCDLSWSAGVLGYELLGASSASLAAAASRTLLEQYDDFGTADRERLAAHWVVTRTADMY